MKRINDCVEFLPNGKIFTKTEKGKSFSLISEFDFCCRIAAIDNCVFGDELPKRCDFLFIVPKDEIINCGRNLAKAYYVELKGDNLKRVCEQIYNAIVETKSQILNHDIEARVVATKGFQPNLLNNEFFRRVKKMIKKEIGFCKVHKGNNFNHIENLS